MSNLSSITNWNFDNSYNGNVIQSGLTAIYSCCYNTKFILLGGSGTSPITYNVLNTGAETTWYPTNAGNLFSTVYSVSSNSGYGQVYTPNRIYLKKNDRLRLVTPKSYNQFIEPESSISFNLYNGQN